MARRRLLGLSILAFLGVATPMACGGGTTTTGCGDGCETGKVCVDGQCVAAPTGGAGGMTGSGGASTTATGTGGGGINIDGGPTCAAALQCGNVCCDEGQFCALGTTCAVDQGTCTTNDECGFDSYCNNGACIPYGLPGGLDHDPSCRDQDQHRRHPPRGPVRLDRAARG
ncbi:MAG: hypothetical protein QM820_04385 [Minicystis sp.]